MSIRLNHNSAALRVCVDRAEQGRISGRVFGQRLVRPIVFTDIGDLLLQVEAVLDAQNFPQAFQRVRTFVPGKMEQQPPAALGVEDGIPAGEVAAAAGQVTTFLLSVVTRRNTTWQGWTAGSGRNSKAFWSCSSLPTSTCSGRIRKQDPCAPAPALRGREDTFGSCQS